MEDKEETMQEKVDKITTTSFSIAGCPIAVFKRFMEFCENNAKVTKIFYNNNKKEVKEELCYSIGLSQLLDRNDKNALVAMLYDRMLKLEDQLLTIIDANNPQPEAKRTIKTMGGTIEEPEVKEDESTK